MKKIVPLIFLSATACFGQRNNLIQQHDPHIGYIYPAGAQRGATTTIIVGGQHLDNVDGIHVSGGGVRAKVVGFERPLDQNEVVRMRNRMQEARKEMGREENARPRNFAQMQTILEQTGLTQEDVRKMREHATMRRDPMIQENTQVADEVTIEIEVLPNARPGRRELRVYCEGRISSPLAFYIGDYPEHTETDGKDIGQNLPTVINGQILPGETDRWTFNASKNDQLVIACTARALIPHLADAVPGWFQATMALYDANGHELAYADDYRFNPDPVLYYKIPADGSYTLEIKDSIYRGRQDFVYRITLGEVPIITSIFPLGGKKGETTEVEIQGLNLPATSGTVGGERDSIDAVKGTPLAFPVPFSHGTLAELIETEPNNTISNAMVIQSTCTINGKIERPGDRDVFAIGMKKGEMFIAETEARRLNSPLDSVIMITDASGNQVAFNDDHEDKSLGVVTHHADSRIVFKATKSGTYHVHLSDTQNQGGGTYAYRLHLGRPQPEYTLRVVPSNLNGPPGASVPFTVYALRKDGFKSAIDLSLLNKIEGLHLNGARIPAGQDQVELTITLPTESLYVAEPLQIEGRAVVNGKPMVRPAVPAEDMMQAFIYHHLVPAEELMLATAETRFNRPPAVPKNNSVVTLKPGRSTTITYEAPTSFDRFQVELEIEPRNIPTGVAIEDVSVGDGLIEVTLATDASAIKGTEGNLLFDQFILRQRGGRSKQEENAPKVLRMEAGTLPAVPFRIM